MPRFEASYLESCAVALSKSRPAGTPVVFHMMEKGFGGYGMLSRFIDSIATQKKADPLVQSQLQAWLSIVLTTPTRTSTIFKSPSSEATSVPPTTFNSLRNLCTKEVRRNVDAYLTGVMLPAIGRLMQQEANSSLPREAMIEELRVQLLEDSAGLFYSYTYPDPKITGEAISVSIGTVQTHAEILEVHHRKAVAMVLSAINAMAMHLAVPLAPVPPLQLETALSHELLKDVQANIAVYLQCISGATATSQTPSLANDAKSTPVTVDEAKGARRKRQPKKD